MATRLKKAIADQPGAETLASSAYERLRFDIISGVFPPEAKLLIRRLCARYEIGLSPIREALNRVSRDGLVKHHEQRGFTVTAVTEADLEDITKARCWANEVALRESIANGDQGWEEAILIAFHRMSRLQGPAEQADHPVDAAWERAHRAFHTSLISACGSSWLSANSCSMPQTAIGFLPACSFADALSGKTSTEISWRPCCAGTPTRQFSFCWIISEQR